MQSINQNTEAHQASGRKRQRLEHLLRVFLAANAVAAASDIVVLVLDSVLRNYLSLMVKIWLVMGILCKCLFVPSLHHNMYCLGQPPESNLPLANFKSCALKKNVKVLRTKPFRTFNEGFSFTKFAVLPYY